MMVNFHWVGPAAALLAAFVLQATAAPLRGSDPALASQYEPANGMFKCLDGGKAVPFRQVNDGYCDCLDGSDEPGTPACPNGKFYCKNVWFVPQILNSSFVDDGVCDCCDGTDEPTGKCGNTCKQKGEEALSGLTTELVDAEAGLAERRKYVKAAAKAIAQWDARLREVSGLEAAAQRRQQQAAAARDRLEKQEQLLQARKTRLEVLVKPAVPSPEQNRAVEEGDAEAPAEGDAADSDGGEEALSTADEGAATEGLDEEAAADSESAEELAKRVASQWIPGGGKKEVGAEEQDAASEDEHVADEKAPTEEVGEQAGEGSESTVDSGVDAEEGGDLELGILDKFAGWAAGAWARVLGRGRSVAALKRTEAALAALQRSLTSARAEATAASAAAEALSTEKRELEDKKGHDYGPDAAYAPLVDRCIEALVDNKYTYRVCPFSKAEQAENSSPTSLGTWKGFDDGFRHLKFAGGQHCWQGPERSMTVSVHCGRAEALARVSEPSRCEYRAEMTTPAACIEKEVAVLRAELAARRGLLKTAKDEL